MAAPTTPRFSRATFSGRARRFAGSWISTPIPGETREVLGRLANLKPTTLARMHGSAWHGDAREIAAGAGGLLETNHNAPARHCEPVPAVLRHPGDIDRNGRPSAGIGIQVVDMNWMPGRHHRNTQPSATTGSAGGRSGSRRKPGGRSLLAGRQRGGRRQGIAQFPSGNYSCVRSGHGELEGAQLGPKNLYDGHRRAVSRRGDNASAADHLWMAGGDGGLSIPFWVSWLGVLVLRTSRVLRLYTEPVVPCGQMSIVYRGEPIATEIELDQAANHSRAATSITR